LLIGLEFTYADGSAASDISLTLVKRLLQRGLIVLPEGEHGEVVSLTPPLTISVEELGRALRILREELAAITEPKVPRTSSAEGKVCAS
jgi:4-aminobutyrate aminotransferase-like enzyme